MRDAAGGLSAAAGADELVQRLLRWGLPRDGRPAAALRERLGPRLCLRRCCLSDSVGSLRAARLRPPSGRLLASPRSAAFMSKLIMVDQAPIKFQIWDTAGAFLATWPWPWLGAGRALARPAALPRGAPFNSAPSPPPARRPAGQEKYHSLAPMYYRGAAAAIIVYDITRAASFTTLKNWVRELQQLGPENIVLAVCGNKADLEDKREVSTAEAKAYADEIKALFIETSAKSNKNVNVRRGRRLASCAAASGPARCPGWA